MEQLIPRSIENGDDMLKAYPSVLQGSCSGSEITGDSAFDLADTNAINKVRIFAPSLTPFLFMLTVASRTSLRLA